MKSFTTLVNLATSLSTNTSSANQALMGQLINDQHRYLLEKYFDNERTVTTTTVGGQSDVGLTAALIAGATSATLDSAWTYPTCRQLVNFSSGEQRNVLFTKSSTAISWAEPLTESATDEIDTVGVQAYSIPANVSKLKNDTITVGQLRYQTIPVQSRGEWDMINFLPYTSDIPQYHFIWNGSLEIFPIPSTTGNILSFNYQTRVADLSFSDYSTGTIDTAGMVSGSTTVTGLATSWLTTGAYPSGSDISYYNLKIKANPPYGDGIWYPIRQFNSNTSLTLDLPVVNAPNITNATTYTIGQFPLLQEDFHDMLVYGALKVYFGSVVKDKDKFEMYSALYQERLQLLDAYAGTKYVNVDLGAPVNPLNPNLFIYSNTSTNLP